MKKSIKLFVVVVVIILVLVIILLSLIGLKNRKPFVSNKSKDNNTNTQQVDITINDVIKKIPKDYSKNVDFQRCAVNEIESCLSNVIRDRMAENNSVELCDDYVTEKMKDTCKFNFTFKKAMKSMDISECNIIKDEKMKNSCILEVDYIKAVKDNSLEVCNNLTKENKVKCINKSVIKIAQNLKDISWCDKIQDDYADKDMCKREVSDLINDEKEKKQADKDLNKDTKKDQKNQNKKQVEEKNNKKNEQDKK